MKTEFTAEEAKQYLDLQAEENDVVRVVDPVTQEVMESTGKSAGDGACCALWGRCERCENCTSLRALQTKGRCYKMEIYNNHTYWILSRYMTIGGKPFVAEIVSDVTDSLLMDSNRRDEVGSIISSYNHLLITDALTGVYNRRFLDENFLPSLDCCHDRGTVVNLAILDLDDFKRVNDSYGHQAGDRLLKDVACFWKLHFDSRRKDRERLTIRYGGDEMLIVTCGIGADAFRAELEKYYRQMRKVCYYSEEINIPFGISFGIASSAEQGADWSWDRLFDMADKRLYDSKAKKKTNP